MMIVTIVTVSSDRRQTQIRADRNDSDICVIPNDPSTDESLNPGDRRLDHSILEILGITCPECVMNGMIVHDCLRKLEFHGFRSLNIKLPTAV